MKSNLTTDVAKKPGELFELKFDLVESQEGQPELDQSIDSKNRIEEVCLSEY